MENIVLSKEICEKIFIVYLLDIVNKSETFEDYINYLLKLMREPGIILLSGTLLRKVRNC